MSNYLALATVTATLQQNLAAALVERVPGATVTTLRPDALAQAQPLVGVNLYLFQVTPNLALANSDLPTRDVSGQFTSSPQTALNLRYLFTCFGKEDRLEPERVLAITTIAMNTQPVLAPDDIVRAVTALPDEALAGSDLALQREPVKFSQAPLTLDELHKLWTIFAPIPYRLSTVYEASVVLLDSDVSRRSNPPVRSAPRLTASPALRPRLDQVSPARIPFAPGKTIRLTGSRLGGKDLTFRIGGVEAQTVTAGPNFAEIAMPANGMAGLLPVTVNNSPQLGEPAVAHILPADTLALLVLPALTAASVTTRKDPRSGGEMQVLIIEPRPAPGAAQSTEVLLNRRTAQNEAPAAFSSTDLLRFAFPSPKSPPGANPGEDVRREFLARGITLSPDATMERGAAEGAFRILDAAAGQAYRVQPAENVSVAYFGLNADDSLQSLVYKIPAIPRGTYLLRYRVNEAESQLTTDLATGQYNGPEVTVV